MRIKLLIISLFLLIVTFNVNASENETFSNSNYSDSGNVKKNIKKSDNLYIEKIGTYSLEKDGCAIYWEVSLDRESQKITLTARQPMGMKCTYPFVKQLPFHRKIFNEIFKDWKKNRFQTLFIGPFSRIEPAMTWNIRIAAASADSSDWEDWRKNYPNHSSGKFINQIFVELANQADVYKELKSLFKEFGLKIELNAVEKVFAGKVRDLPFSQELQSKGLKDDLRLIYDAGIIYFSISLNN